MKKPNPITQRSGDLDGMLAHLPDALTEQPITRIRIRSYFGTVYLFTAKLDPRWAPVPAYTCLGRVETLTDEQVLEWSLVRHGADPDGVVYWSVHQKDREGAILQVVESSTLERWKSFSINGHDISHFSEETDANTVFPAKPPKKVRHLARVK